MTTLWIAKLYSHQGREVQLQGAAVEEEGGEGGTGVRRRDRGEAEGPLVRVSTCRVSTMSLALQTQPAFEERGREAGQRHPTPEQLEPNHRQ